MPKLGRKLCCDFKRDVGCICLIRGKKVCIIDVTTDVQFYQKHEMEHVFCPLFPESEKVVFMSSLKELGSSIIRRFYE